VRNSQCRARNVKSVFICPRHPQQNYAEGYIGRVTAMASFAMVFAGAPLFMWVFAIRTATFVSNISASYYSKQDLWATPYEVVHGEPFPDASIVVPFGCAVLVLRDSNDRPKFQARCTMMVFVHYSDDHPLFTYAVYSPRTERVLHRQDVIFLTSVFPMREARVASGLGPEGESLKVFRSPPSMLDGCPDDLSFGTWALGDALPAHDDDVTGFAVSRPYDGYVAIPVEGQALPVHRPNHVSFPESAILVPIPAAPTSSGVLGTLDHSRTVLDIALLEEEENWEDFSVNEGDSVCSSLPSVDISPESVPPVILQDGELRNSVQEKDNFDEFRHWDVRHDKFEAAVVVLDPRTGCSAPTHDVNDVGVRPAPSRCPVHQRWYYEPVSSVVESVPTRSKRVSKLPQRLTSSRKSCRFSHSPPRSCLGVRVC
jgi:hypothetical protein